MLAQYYFVMSNNTYLVIRRGSEVHFHMVFGCFVTKCWDCELCTRSMLINTTAAGLL